MQALHERSRTSTRAATLVGAGAGLTVVLLYVGAGLLVADWSTSEFLAQLSPTVVGYVVGMVSLVVAVVGVPVLAFLRYDLTAPLAVLAAALVAWLAIGVFQGVLSLQTVFGLGLYAAMFSPVYLALYGVLGGGEYLLRLRAGA